MWKRARLLAFAALATSALTVAAQVNVTYAVHGDVIEITSANSSDRTAVCDGQFTAIGYSFGQQNSRQQHFNFTVAAKTTTTSVRSPTTWGNVRVEGFSVHCSPSGLGQSAAAPSQIRTICIGELESPLCGNRPNLSYWPCGTNPNNAADSVCRGAHSAPELIANPGGNHCGYAIFSVKCQTP